MKLLGTRTSISMAYAKQTENSAAPKKMSNSLDTNMVHRACRRNSHDSLSQVLKIIAKWQTKLKIKLDLPRSNQRLPGPVGTDKQCNA